MKFKLDENLGASAARAVAALGHDVHTAAEEGLLSQPDHRIADAAAAEGRVVVTIDTDFSDERRFPPGTHPGIVVLRPRGVGRESVKALLVRFLKSEDLSRVEGSICIVETTRVRYRRPKPADPE
jgi:predicted nuclease of predicted toxin-antitoxin system